MQIDPYVKATLDRWLWQGLESIYQAEAQRPRPGVVLGAALWGKSYAERFDQWCVPSLLEPHNLDALSRSGSRIVIAGPVNDLRRLFIPLRRLEMAGIDVQKIEIPLEVMGELAFEENGRYWLLGVAQALLLRLTARLGMGFHMLMPDHVYCQGFYASLLRLGRTYKAIALNTVSADLNAAGPALDLFRTERGTLVIPPIALGNIGWQYLHAQMQTFIMGKRGYPDSHYMLWPGEDRLWIYSPHASIAWLDNEFCRRAPVITPATLDTQLPKLMPYGAYVPVLEDGLTLIEISDSDKPSVSRRVSLDECLARCAMSIELKEEYLPWFALPSYVPILPQAHFIAADTIRRRQSRITGQITGAIKRIKTAAGDHNAYISLDAQAAVKSPQAPQCPAKAIRAPYSDKWEESGMNAQLEAESSVRPENVGYLDTAMVERIIAEVRPYSMVPAHGIAKTIELTINAINSGIPGDLVECGTWKGGCSFAMLLAQRYAYGEIRRRIWMYDSFQGMGEPHEVDGNHARGWLKQAQENPDDPGHFNKCAASLEEAYVGASNLRLLQSIIWERGWFQNTIRHHHPDQIAVLRVDCDWYEPCKLVLEQLAPLVSPGGSIIMDDYSVWEGCTIATHEYLAEHRLPWRLRYISDLCGAYMIKEAQDWW